VIDKFYRSLLIKITLNLCHLLSSSTLGEVSEGCGRDSFHQLIRNKGTK